MVPVQENTCVEIRKNAENMATKMVPELDDQTYEERLKEMQRNTLEEKRERDDLITIYELMNNLEETDRKCLILRKKKRLEI